jgi:hypothetical protein
MALTANLIPSQITTFPCPYDATLAFCSAQTLNSVASGFLAGNVNATIDLGGATPVSAAGRTDFVWNMDITVLDETTTDETYQIFLVGSNDVAFGNGNCELLAMHDFGLAANRIIATVLGTTPVVPPTNLGGTIIQIPCTNLMQRIYYRYLKVYTKLAGTTPILTFTSWISRAEIDI